MSFDLEKICCDAESRYVLYIHLQNILGYTITFPLIVLQVLQEFFVTMISINAIPVAAAIPVAESPSYKITPIA